MPAPAEAEAAALVEESRALWSIFLWDSTDVNAGRKCFLGLEKSGCGTISPMLETTNPT